MKTLIIALNSKYIHSALAPWYLKSACGTECGEVLVAEYTVNETYDVILGSIYMHKPDIAAFSCYIWNISHVLRLAASLKKLLPGITIILGGPEVSYDVVNIMDAHSFINFVLAGEGDCSFPKLLKYIHSAVCIEKNETGMAETDFKSKADLIVPEHIDGLSYRIKDSQLPGVDSKESIVTNAPALVEVLDSIPSPYTDEMISCLQNKIVYFEASRGCPFSCSYCLSSASEGVRYFSLGRVFSDLDRLVAAGVKQIKFVDRTFNSNKKRAVAIIRYIMELDKQASTDHNAAGGASGKYNGLGCNFHFEVGADLFDEEILQLLECAPKGLFQIEAGVQTTNEAALAAVCRKTNTAKLLSNLSKLQKSGSVHIHADLIAGLPHEDYASFAKSFNMLYASRPHQLQLGFLKFLKGTVMRDGALYDGYKFNDFPPYEILSGNSASYDELIVLKGVADLLERYYNSGRFIYTLEYIIGKYFESPFQFFENFYFFQKKNGTMYTPVGVKELFSIMNRFVMNCLNGTGTETFSELLKLDFLASDPSGTLPDFMEKQNEPGFHERCYQFLKNTEHIVQIIPEASGMTAKQLLKKVHFERFRLDTLMFCYMSRDKVTGRYPFFTVQI